MLVELKLVTTNSTLVNAKVINAFSYKLSNILQSYQAKTILKPSSNQTEALEFVLSIYQEKELVSFNSIKSDLKGQPNPKREIPKKPRKIPSLLGIGTISFLEPLVSNSF